MNSETWILHQTEQFLLTKLQALKEEVAGKEKEYPREDMFNTKEEYFNACDNVDQWNAHRQHTIDMFEKWGVK